jgi:hypothetical protein
MTAARTPSRELLEFLGPYPPQVRDLALAVRDKVIAIAPTANETVWDAVNAVSIGFSFEESFLHIAVYSKHVNLGFNRGTELPDPKKILTGTGTHIRHIKLQSAADAEPSYIKAAIKFAGGAIKQEPQLTIRRMNSQKRRRPNA